MIHSHIPCQSLILFFQKHIQEQWALAFRPSNKPGGTEEESFASPKEIFKLS